MIVFDEIKKYFVIHICTQGLESKYLYACQSRNSVDVTYKLYTDFLKINLYITYEIFYFIVKKYVLI